jgi:hypothetical protein
MICELLSAAALTCWLICLVQIFWWLIFDAAGDELQETE